MKKIEINICGYEELEPKVQKKAISEIRKLWEKEDRGYDFLLWAIDDCSLFEPTEEEMCELLGDEYHKGYEFVLGNTRDRISFCLSRWEHDFSNAIVINNDDHFMKWLGISPQLHNHENFSCSITTDNFGRRTSIFLSIETQDESILEIAEDQFPKAEEKFNNHMDAVMKRIEADVRYRWSDDGVEEEIISSGDYFFLEDGSPITEKTHGHIFQALDL